MCIAMCTHLFSLTKAMMMMLGKPMDKASIDTPVLLQTSQQGFPLIGAKKREGFFELFNMS